MRATESIRWAMTGIGKRVAEAVDKLRTGDFEGALIPACIAVAATSRKVRPTGPDHAVYKAFLRDHIELITRVAFGNIAILNLRIEFSHADLIPDHEGLVTLEQILYHVVRCGLIHEAELTTTLKFTDDGIMKVDQLPAKLIHGMIGAVLADASNADETIEPGYGIMTAAGAVPLQSLWGRRDEVFRVMLDGYRS